MNPNFVPNKNPHWLAFTGLPSDMERVKFLDEIAIRFSAPLKNIAVDYFGFKAGSSVSCYFSKHHLRVDSDRKRFNSEGIQQDWKEFCAISVKPIEVQPTGYRPILPTKQQKELDHQRLMDSTIAEDETAAEAVMAAATVSMPRTCDENGGLSVETKEIVKAPTCNCTLFNCGWQGSISELIQVLTLFKPIIGEQKISMWLSIRGGKDETAVSDQ